MATSRAVAQTPAPHLFDQLFALSQEAHTLGQHEVAYHALTAAMHAAQDSQNVAGLRGVVKEAQRQIASIDANTPAQRLSTTSAGRHNHPGVYAMLARQAETIADMLSPR